VKILLLNQDWFASELKEAGHEVLTCGLARHLDAVLELPLIHIDTICKEYLNGFEPEAIVIHDNSAPIVIEGLEETSLPTLFYSIDVHHHHEFHIYLAKVFDHTLVAQKDYMHLFDKVNEKPEWMPLWAPRLIEPSNEKKYGAVFVGTLDEKLNPDRVKFFNELQQQIEIVCRQGHYHEVFPFAELVINQTVRGDLNFRVFEAMMCGSMLLTEQSGNGLHDLFKEGVHLTTYPKGSVGAAAEAIHAALADKKRTREVAAAGREEILRAHCSHHRAERVHEILKSLTPRPFVGKRYPWMINFWVLSRRLSAIDMSLAKRSLVSALKAAERGIREGEPLDQEMAFNFVHACSRYEWFFGPGSSERILQEAQEAYPDRPILVLARIRGFLNQGRMQEAERLAMTINQENPKEIFQQAEDIMQTLLSTDEGDMWDMALPPDEKK
jgi:hypothetical protein